MGLSAFNRSRAIKAEKEKIIETEIETKEIEVPIIIKSKKKNSTEEEN